jgi:hypothetical protein
MSQDTIIELSKIYNALLEVEVKGNSVMLLAAIMSNLKNIVASEQNKLNQQNESSENAVS